jgi:predicted secreted hydrolase
MRLILTILALLLASGVIIAYFERVEPGEIRAEVGGLAELEAGREFARAYAPRPFIFPDDLGQHPDYRIEWWYYTGNLADAAGQRFGFQLTFFRRGLTPGLPTGRTSEWANTQVYFAHFTITDVAGETFNYYERFSRGSPHLAGAESAPYHVWLEDWQAQEVGPGQVALRAKAAEVALDLVLEQTKPPALHGNRGLSLKSSEPGNANYYYSFTRNKAAGTITTPRGIFHVTGSAWKDHEWGTSDMGAGTVGWDWFSLQLDDGREVMFYAIRREDGRLEEVSGGVIVEADGTTRHLAKKDVEYTPRSTWRSDASGATYPAEWDFAIPKAGIELHLTPLLPQQELQVSFTYWEGAITIEGTQQGYGYVELTGYESSLRGRM